MREVGDLEPFRVGRGERAAVHEVGTGGTMASARPGRTWSERGMDGLGNRNYMGPPYASSVCGAQFCAATASVPRAVPVGWTSGEWALSHSHRPG